MLKHIFLIAVFGFFWNTQSLFAQKRGFVPEFDFGLSASQVDGDSYGGFDRFGGVVSLGVRNRFHKKYSFKIAAQIAQKGSAKRANTKIQDYNIYQMNLLYAEVPISVTFHTQKFGFSGGLSAGGLVYHREKDNNGVLINQPEFNRFELGGFVGIRYLVSSKFFVNLTLGNSLVSIRDLLPNQKSIHLRSGQTNVWIFTKIGWRLRNK